MNMFLKWCIYCITICSGFKNIVANENSQPHIVIIMADDMFELVYFEHALMDRSSQYRWFTVDYQVGVFIARSSVNVVHFKKIWLMAVFQFINLIYFLLESIFCVTPSIWISFAIILWEGLLGGGAYVNTFYRMSLEIPEERRKFALAIVIQSDSIGITTAALLSLPVHNAICDLAAVERSTEW